MSFFDNIPLLPQDPILNLPIEFAADPRKDKINLGIGEYKNAEGQTVVLNCVRKAEQLLLNKNLNKNYLPIEGDPEFIRAVLPLLFNQIPLSFTAQTIGGASALRIAGEFLSKLLCKNIFISNPSWLNHKLIFERAGLNVQTYPYFNTENFHLDFEGLCESIRNMAPGSVILFHGCCHNPTGVDPTLEQWKELSSLVKKQKLIPIFDIAYQGFGQGIEEDIKGVQHFVKEGHEMFIAYSFSKNFGLYGERVGFLTTIASDPKQIPLISSQIKKIIRGNYSNPPLHGARIISTILKSPDLTLEWKSELSQMRTRIQHMRESLVQALLKNNAKRNFPELLHQNGLFFYMGLSDSQVKNLREEKGIFIPNNGRINIAGLNEQNLSYVANALLSVMPKNV